MRIKYTYTSKWRICFWTCGTWYFYVYALGHPELERYFGAETQYKFLFTIDLDYEEWKRRERYRWSEYLRNWDPVQTGNTGRGNMGYLSSSVFDKWFYGKRKHQEPPKYDDEANQLITHAERSGVDPAGPMLDSIQKMVDYYYPDDLDDDLESTKRVIAPKLQWVYDSDFDEVVDDEEKKPKANSLGRYLWFIPGYSDYFDNLKLKARNEEEQFLLSSDYETRTKFYENTDRMAQRWSLELNDYAPLLAGRFDKKRELALFLMREDNKEFILNTLKKPGGVKKIFLAAGIINPDPLQGDQYEPIH